MDLKTAKPFFIIALAWLLLSGLLIFKKFGNSPEAVTVALGTLAFWGLSLVSLFVLAKLVSLILGLTTTPPEKRMGAAIQAFYWAVFKLACVGILITALIRASQATTPGFGLAVVLGMGTLCIVPLGGGYLWSRKGIHHA